MSKKAETLGKAIGSNRFKRKELVINLESDSIQLENTNLKSEVSRLKLELKRLKAVNKSLEDSNDLKLIVRTTGESDELILYKFKELQAVGTINMFRAIKEESRNQDTETPTITRATFEDPYRVNGASIVKSREALESHGFIKTIRDHQRKTRYQVLKNLPNL
jgi:hypothetical protein